MKLNLLQKEFEKLCENYGMTSSALGTKFQKDKKECSLELLCRCVKLQLVYRARSPFPVPPSTLFCRVYLNKNDRLFLHLPQLLPLIGKRDFRACYFPYIENENRMAACFRELTGFLEELLPELEAFASDAREAQPMEVFLKEEGFRAENIRAITQFDSREQKMYLAIQKKIEKNILVRYTVWKPWEAYLLGDRQRAKEQLKKQKHLLAYDRDLIQFLSSRESSGFRPIPDDCFAIRDMRSVSRGLEDGGTLFLSMLLCYPVFAAIACLLMGVLQLLHSSGTLCWFGPAWYEGLLLGGIPVVFGGIALRRLVMPILNRKNSKMQLDFDDVINGTGWDRFTTGIFLLAVIASLVCSFSWAGECLQLYEDHGKVEGEVFVYEDVEAIYYISARYNSDGDRIERPSYVIVLTDGTQIDFNKYADAQKTADEALPIFLSLGLEPIELDSNRDLPEAG